MYRVMLQMFLVALVLFTSCGNSTGKKNSVSYPNDTDRTEQRASSDSLKSAINATYTMDADSVYFHVHSVNFTQLDTISTLWNMTKDDVRSFFEGAIPATNSEVAQIVSENYYPFSVTGKITLEGQDYDYVINPVGVAILFPSSVDENSQYLLVRNEIDKATTQDRFTNNLRLKILSCHKRSYDNDDELGRWCKDWRMSATDIDDYFKLCKPWDESAKGSVVTLFDNYNCDISGYLEMDGNTYSYRLWCNGPLFLTPIKIGGHLESQSYVCQDDAGLKYLYTIDKNPTLDI